MTVSATFLLSLLFLGLKLGGVIAWSWWVGDMSLVDRCRLDSGVLWSHVLFGCSSLDGKAPNPANFKF